MLTLWYEKPAEKWVEALPVGNGRLGAMVFGGVETERIQLDFFRIRIKENMTIRPDPKKNKN